VISFTPGTLTTTIPFAKGIPGIYLKGLVDATVVLTVPGIES
jgi:hypothetical protein